MQAPSNAYAVILAGGGGTRLWPKSRRSRPKHLLKLLGKETLLKITYDRIRPIIPDERILIVTVDDHANLVKKEVPSIPAENIIAEPQSKNTALAMGTAVAFIQARNPKAVIVNLSADHIYQDIDRFQKTVLAAIEVANNHPYIVAVGIKPNFPHTGLGYIRTGDQLGHVRITEENSGLKDVYAFKCLGFKEKPDLATAQSFLATGQYLWNAGLYIWSVETIMEALLKHAPDVAALVKEEMEAIGTPSEAEVLKKVYQKAENIQIDYAVSEKAKNIAIIPGDFGWSDVGDWKVVFDSLPKDELNNAIIDPEGDHLSIDTRDSLIETNGRLIVTIGVEDLVVVDSADAILICHKNRSQDVKKVVEKLKAGKKDQYL